MTLATQPFPPEGVLLGCVLLYFGFHLLAVAQNFGLVLWQVAVGVAASSEASQNDLAGHCFV